MTITNPRTAGAAVHHDADEAARRALAAVSLGAVAPESYPGRLHGRDRLTEFAQAAFGKVRPDASAIAAAARGELDELRRTELRTDPFASGCFGPAACSLQALPGPLEPVGINAAVAALITEPLVAACRDVDRAAARKLKLRKPTERKRRRLKAEIDLFNQKLRPVLADHIAGLVRDDLSAGLARRDELNRRSQTALRRRRAEAADPGDDIPGSHRFSCGPRVEVVLKAVAVKRPDLLDRDGRPTDAMWAAFGAKVASADLGVMEDPHRAIDALQQFLESTVAEALDGLTLDALYALTAEPPEVPNWIGRSAARLQAVSREEPYRVRLAQVPATASDALYQQILHHIQTATRSEDANRLQLVELTYAFCADEVLRADPRGLGNVLASIQPHASNPQLALVIRGQLATNGSRGLTSAAWPAAVTARTAAGTPPGSTAAAPRASAKSPAPPP
jgi:hypothetical protein